MSAPLRASLILAAFTLVWGVGCASSNVPESDVTAELATARAALGQADQAQAGEYAALDLRNARAKLEQAQAAFDSGERTMAMRLAQQAAVDAELAQVKARSTQAQLAVDEVQESIRALREEIERNRSGSGQ